MTFDPHKFKALYLSFTDIWKRADDFRTKYSPKSKLPINVFDIVEFDLGLYIQPFKDMYSAVGIEALLLGDLTTILVDEKLYMSQHSQNRLRFSLAHEVGHLVLHKHIYGKLEHNSVEDWIQLIEAIPEEQYYWIEQHAYEFAGRLLVPPERLNVELQRAIKKAEKYSFSKWDLSGETALEYVSHEISRPFGVSWEVISRRLRKENLWPIE